MTAFSALDLSALPPPDFVEVLDYEVILAAMKADLLVRAPELANVLALESEPIVKLLEVVAYRELTLRSRINHAARASMLATAIAADLDNLVANLGVIRAAGEDDARLRARAALAVEGFTSAGPVGAYLFHALSADADVADVLVQSLNPGVVTVTVLAGSNDGTPTPALLTAVDTALNDENVRPLTDQVLVQAATIIPYTITADLLITPGPDTEIVRAAAEIAVTAYAATRRRLGRDVTLSGLYAALHQSGVEQVTLTAPAADVVIADTEASFAQTITVTGAQGNA